MYTKAALEVVEQLEAEAIDDGVVDEAKGTVFNDELAFVHSFYKTSQSRGSQKGRNRQEKIGSKSRGYSIKASRRWHEQHHDCHFSHLFSFSPGVYRRW